MSIVQWSDSFKIGEGEIDKEHWGLFALIHDLEDKLLQGAAETSIHATIDALEAYVNVHFEHEERAMRECDYPELEAHRRAHAALTFRVVQLKREYELAPESFDYEAMMEFLSNWLSEHILKLDMDFAIYHKGH